MTHKCLPNKNLDPGQLHDSDLARPSISFLLLKALQVHEYTSTRFSFSKESLDLDTLRTSGAIRVSTMAVHCNNKVQSIWTLLGMKNDNGNTEHIKHCETKP